MGWETDVKVPEGERNDDVREALGADEWWCVMRCGGDWDGLFDELVEVTDVERDKEGVTHGHVKAADLLRFGNVAGDVRDCCPQLAVAALMGDDAGGDAAADWLDGVTSRRHTSYELPEVVSVTLPETKASYDATAEYWHRPTMRERIERRDADDSDAAPTPTFDVRPTVALDGAHVPVKSEIGTFEASEETRDPRLAMQAAAALYGVALADLDDHERHELASSLRVMPETTLSFLDALSEVGRACKRAKVETLDVERYW